jgi:glutathione reductase (NADPH)
MSAFDFDLFVIGAGSGGVRACRIAANLGARVGVAEERYFGGTCVNVGCVPKKLFSYAAHYHDDFQDSAGFGWSIDGVRFDWDTLKENKDNEINRLNDIYKSILDNNEVTVFQARARIKSAHEIDIDGKIVTAKNVLIAVGGWPWVPEYPGSQYLLNSNDIFAMEKLPKSMMIAGGGYIAVEFASIFSRLGCETTLIYRGDKLLRGFDEDVRDFITTELAKDFTVKLNTDISRIENKNNELTVFLNNGSQVVCEAVLSATGRKPMTSDLGLENTAIRTAENGAIVVNDSFQTDEPSIYAVGDVIDRIALTPVALAEGQLVARALFSGEARAMNYKNVPSAVFCHPNLSTVGLSESEALAAGMELDIYLASVKLLKHTLSGRNEMSFIKLVVDKMSDRVIGLHMVGPDAGELVQGFAVAMNSGATKADFDNTIGIHPTLAEEFVTMRTKRKLHG